MSASTIYRWTHRITPYCQTGNRTRSQLVGFDMINIVCFIIAHPDSTCEEIAVFIYNEGVQLYDNSTTSKQLKELQITKKKASTEEY